MIKTLLGVTAITSLLVLLPVDSGSEGARAPERQVASTHKMFEAHDRMDTNRDGFVSRQEIAAAEAKLLKNPAK